MESALNGLACVAENVARMALRIELDEAMVVLCGGSWLRVDNEHRLVGRRELRFCGANPLRCCRWIENCYSLRILLRGRTGQMEWSELFRGSSSMFAVSFFQQMLPLLVVHAGRTDLLEWIVTGDEFSTST